MIPDPNTIATKLAGFSITTGEILRNGDYVSLVLTSDARLAADPEDHHSHLCVLFNGAVMHRENAFPVTAQAALQAADEVISISAGGSVRRSSPPPRGAENEAMVGDMSGKKVHGRTRLTDAAAIDGIVHAVGTRCAAYRRVAPGAWEAIDESCYGADDFSRGFNAVDGFSREELYAVGEQGEIWRFDGTAWHREASPTNASLNTVCCAADGMVYAAGAQGTIVAGRQDQWRVLPDVPEGYEFWGSAFHDGALYLTANLRGVLKLVDGQVETVDFGACRRPLTAYHLKARGSDLWLFGSKDVRRLASGTWTEIATLA